MEAKASHEAAVEAKPQPSHRRSRRELVVAGAAAAAGAAVAVVATSGGGSRPQPAQRPVRDPLATTEADADLGILGALLELERHCVRSYRLATQGLIGGSREVAETLLLQERAHAIALERSIRDLGATPAPAGTYAEWGAARAAASGRRATLSLVRGLEERSVGAYLDALEQISTEDVRVTIAAILAAEAEHLAVVLGELGEPQLQAPFVLGTGA